MLYGTIGWTYENKPIYKSESKPHDIKEQNWHQNEKKKKKEQMDQWIRVLGS